MAGFKLVISGDSLPPKLAATLIAVAAEAQSTIGIRVESEGLPLPNRQLWLNREDFRTAAWEMAYPEALGSKVFTALGSFIPLTSKRLDAAAFVSVVEGSSDEKLCDLLGKAPAVGYARQYAAELRSRVATL